MEDLLVYTVLKRSYNSDSDLGRRVHRHLVTLSPFRQATIAPSTCGISPHTDITSLHPRAMGLCTHAWVKIELYPPTSAGFARDSLRSQPCRVLPQRDVLQPCTEAAWYSICESSPPPR